MNTHLVLILAFILLISCNKSQKFEVDVSTDFGDGKTAYLIEIGKNNQPIKADSVIIENGEFSFSKTIQHPNMNYIQVEDFPGYFLFIVEAGVVKMELFKDQIPEYSISGTTSNSDLQYYRSTMTDYQKSLQDIGNDAYKAQTERDTLLFNDLREQYESVESKIYNYDINFISDNPQSFLSLVLLTNYTAGNIISKDSLMVLYDGLSTKIKKGPVNDYLINILDLDTPGVEIGEIAPNFRGTTPSGNTVSLAESVGKITLIDFWASWCKPCRVQSPELVELHNKYSSNGLEIISVSLDKKESEWIQAIKDDGLNWLHVSHLKSWFDPIATKYNVKEIPTIFLLDSNRLVLDKGSHLSSIKFNLQRQLNSL